MRIFLLFIIYSACFLNLIWVLLKNSDREKNTRQYVCAKTISSLAFVLTALYCATFSDNTKLLIFLLPAFLCCMLGDMIIGIFQQIRKKSCFYIGVLCFFLGHLCFIRHLISLQPLQLIDFMLPVSGLIFLFFLLKLPGFQIKSYLPFTLVYSFFVSLFFAKGLRYAITVSSNYSICLAMGAGLFFLSDFLILFLYFYHKKSKAVHVANLTTYYYGVFLLAISFLFT